MAVIVLTVVMKILGGEVNRSDDSYSDGDEYDIDEDSDFWRRAGD